jgi:hypothetical protein
VRLWLTSAGVVSACLGLIVSSQDSSSAPISWQKACLVVQSHCERNDAITSAKDYSCYSTRPSLSWHRRTILAFPGGT